ncbi:hypothetical protein O6H91_14G019700 [Diphasiastrum complanatum]|uniref:Uncharacterized protein n=1 Tax=Diphasiastrum complanatum TaxID=34168 RepID=A0ACC2BM04_DIPCM|nr:hypothetical protein O6H91_14G019700 [Diphasiastrum complanatum]
MDAGSAAAFYAGTVLLRKTFEAVAQRSVSSLFSRLHSRFRGQSQLQSLQKELEARLQVLSLPVDMCVQYVLHGNTALQGALDMALRLINDIVTFQEELEAQSYNESIAKLSPADAVSRLESFLTKLDAILPYLSVAMNALSLLRMSNHDLSPSRLIEASHMVRTADTRQGVITSICGKLHKFETCLTLPRWQEKLISCNATFRRTCLSSGNGYKDYEMVITAEEDNGDVQTCISVPITNICALGSSTLHVLGLGEHELEPVLLLDVALPTAGKS